METSDAKKVGGYLKEKAIIALTRVTENEVDRAIIKVTSHKLKPPNEKHLKRLVAATFASRPEYDPRTPPKDIVKQLEGRLHSHKWIVALKTLVTLHTLLKQGSGEMVLAMARHSGLFHVSHLKDFTDIEAGSHPAFIQRYARYLEERCMAVLHMGCKQKIEKSEELKKEIEELPFSSALRATEALALVLSVLTGLELAEHSDLWEGNECTIHAFKLVVQDSMLLYVLLSQRSLWLLDNGSLLSPAEKETALSSFELYLTHSEKLLTMFKRIKQKKCMKRVKLPDLTPLPKEALEQLHAYLCGSRDLPEHSNILTGIQFEPTDLPDLSSPSTVNASEVSPVGEMSMTYSVIAASAAPPEESVHVGANYNISGRTANNSLQSERQNVSVFPIAPPPSSPLQQRHSTAAATVTARNGHLGLQAQEDVCQEQQVSHDHGQARPVDALQFETSPATTQNAAGGNTTKTLCQDVMFS